MACYLIKTDSFRRRKNFDLNFGSDLFIFFRIRTIRFKVLGRDESNKCLLHEIKDKDKLLIN